MPEREHAQAKLTIAVFVYLKIKQILLEFYNEHLIIPMMKLIKKSFNYKIKISIYIPCIFCM